MTQQPDTATRSESRALHEKQLVGSLIAFSVGRKKPFLAADVLDVCPPECFISPARHIMQAISDVVRAGLAVDLVSVSESLKTRAGGEALPVHPAEYSTWAAESLDLVTEGHVLDAASSIAAEWRKDNAALEMAGAEQCMKIYGAPLDLAVGYLKTAQEILDSGTKGEDLSLDAHLGPYITALETDRVSRPVPSPWQCVNGILRGGVLPGELVILAARPSVGKSALALNWAWSVACSGKRTLFFSLEMALEQLLDRLTANAGSHDLGMFRQGMTQSQRAAVLRTAHELGGRPLDITDKASMSVDEVRRLTRIAKRKSEVGLVVVDYLQLVKPADRKAQREQQVAAMSRGFKLLAKELGVPILLLAQLSRKGEDANREPVLSDLRESGAIEQDADIVIFLHQARKRTWHTDEPVKFIVAKGRSSGVGRGSLIFRRRIQRFEESTDDVFRVAEQEEYAQENHWSETESGVLM